MRKDGVDAHDGPRALVQTCNHELRGVILALQRIIVSSDTLWTWM